MRECVDNQQKYIEALAELLKVVGIILLLVSIRAVANFQRSF